jgi:hypothetical protein
MDSILSRTEANNEAEFLTKQSGRLIRAAFVGCECEYDRDCGKCYGEGGYYQMVYSFCNHVVQESEDSESCVNDFCIEREQVAGQYIDPFAVKEFKSLSESNSEAEELEAVL